MLLSLALRAGELQDALATRRKAALGTWAWPLWLMAWVVPRLLFVWLFDLAQWVYDDAASA